ncbi:MAG: choice-of-anchor Q domain-containing protein [Kofleriaceae bacterium]
MGVPMPQVFGPCSYPSSMIQDDISGLAFIEPEAPAPYDYKLAPGSSAVDKAVTSSLIDIDFEGDMRPQGSNKDVGADELMP